MTVYSRFSRAPDETPPRHTRRTARGPGRAVSGAGAAAVSDPAAVPAAAAPLRGAPGPAAAPRTGAAAEETGSATLALVFLISLFFPMVFRLGPLVLFPYRVILVFLFIPIFIKVVSGRAGGMLAVDWLFLGATAWSCMALFANHPPASVIDTSGIFTLEFLGCYMMGRVAVRSAETFLIFVRMSFIAIVCLLPFGMVEALTDVNILLDALPGAIRDTNQGVRMGINRVQTIFAHSIHYGVFCSLLLGLGWYAFAPEKKALRYLVVLPITGVSTFLSMATGALIAFNVQIILIAWETVLKTVRKRWVIFAWLSVAGYIFVDIMAAKSPFHTIVARLAFSQTSAYNRILIFDHGMRNVYANPLLGLGMNDWERPSYMGASTDNFWLLFAMRYGVPAFAMFALAIFLIMRRAARAPLTDPRDQACRAAFLTAMGGMIIAGGTVDYWKNIYAYMLFFIGTGVWIFSGGAKAGAEPEPEAEPEPGPDRRERRNRAR